MKEFRDNVLSSEEYKKMKIKRRLNKKKKGKKKK